MYEVAVLFPIKPKPGQFVSLIDSGKREIPLSISDYYNGILFLHLSEKIYDTLKGKERILLKGPIGRPVDLSVSSVLGIAYQDLFFDILYILREAKRNGIKVKVKCIECETNEFQIGNETEKFDLIIASVPQNFINSLPKDAYVYVRWIKMNCMLGVCGVCEIGSKLVCIDGPLIKVSDLVDQRQSLGK
ncbi:2-polyprenylphenol hydroxylase [Sulfurisphaera javensis]